MTKAQAANLKPGDILRDENDNRMSNKKSIRGRPKSESPASKQYRIRLTSDQYNKLKELSEKEGLPMSEIIKIGIDLYFKDHFMEDFLYGINSNDRISS